jgi:hypothetical protein
VGRQVCRHRGESSRAGYRPHRCSYQPCVTSVLLWPSFFQTPRPARTSRRKGRQHVAGNIGTDPMLVTAITFVETADRCFLSRTIGLPSRTHLRFLPQPPFPQTVCSESNQQRHNTPATRRRSTRHPDCAAPVSPLPAGYQPYGDTLSRVASRFVCP